MKKLFTIAVLLSLALSGVAQEIHYDFAETVESGQTLYFLKGYYGPQDVMVTYPCYHDTIIYNSSGASTHITTYYYGHEEPSGDMVIPSTIIHNDTVYTITRISENAFWKCTNITSLTLPNTLTSITQSAFTGCTGITGEVVIPDAVTNLGTGSFFNCTSINSVVFGNSLQKIGYNAFEGCTSLEYISPFPESLTRIYDHAFEDCINLSGTIVIPHQITQLDEKVFSNCNITSVVIPEGVISIKSGAFARCPLDSIYIPASVTSIKVDDGYGIGAFSGCTNLQSIRVNETNSVYDSRDNCNALIETATNTLLKGCKNTTIPNTISIIWEYAFAGCSDMDSITIPNSIESIYSNAFLGCNSLSTIVLPSSVSYIGDAALACSGLTSIISKSTTPPTAFYEIDDYLPINSFYSYWDGVGVDSDIPIYIPLGTTEAYQNASGWNYFTNFIEETPILYTDFEPDTCFTFHSSNDTLKFDLDQDGTGDIVMFAKWHSAVGFIAVITTPSSDWQWSWTYASEFTGLTDTTLINGNLKWRYSGGNLAMYPEFTHFAFRHSTEDGYCYGWAHIHAESLARVCVYDMAYCTIPNYPLILGQTNINLIGENGVEWYYEILNDDGSITYQHLECVGDTLIERASKRPKVIVRSNTHYDRDTITEVTHEYVYEENGIVYWWNKDLQEFTTLYNLYANAGDEWEIKVGYESLIMHVDAVETIEYEDRIFRMLRVSDSADLFSGNIVCGIGHLTSFFPEKLMNRGKGYRVEGIRCYWIDGELVFKNGDRDCDEIYIQLHDGIDEPGENGPSTGSGTLTVYPNPANGVLFVETRLIASLPDPTYRITNLMGQTLLQGYITAEKQQINIEKLPAGMYFITYAGETLKFVVK